MVAIKYNETTISTPVEKFSFQQDYKSISFSTSILVTASTSSSLVIACNSLEALCKLKNKRLQLTFGGSSEYDYNPTTTGFNSIVKLTKSASESDTATSRLYDFFANIQIPYSEAGFGYRRDASFIINYEGTRRKVANFRLSYTSGGGNSAKTNYTSGGKAWASTIMTDYGGTWELVAENINEEQERNLLEATLTYRQLLSNETSSGQSSSIVRASCSYNVSSQQMVGKQLLSGFNAKPLTTVSLSYNAEISKDAVLSDTSIEPLYRQSIKPWLVRQIKNLLGLSNYSNADNNIILTNDNYRMDPYNYVIGGNITAYAIKSFEDIFFLSEEITINEDRGLIYTKLWDGNDYTYNTYSSGAERIAIRNVSITKFGAFIGEPPAFDTGQGEIWLQLSHTERRKKEEYQNTSGVGDASTAEVSYQYFSERFLYVKPTVFETTVESPGVQITYPAEV
jgi:hypothetical protein